jgi:predicted Zn-dependent protease with MMP-like domain
MPRDGRPDLEPDPADDSPGLDGRPSHPMIQDWPQMMAVARREVAATVKSLPAPLQEKARLLPVTYEPWPNEDLLEDGIADDTLGLFVGGDYAEGEHEVMPAQIILFLENIREMVEGDETEFRAEVRTTLLHELGHYLGLDENALLDRGLE